MWCTTSPMCPPPPSHVPHVPQCHTNLIMWSNTIPMCPTPSLHTIIHYPHIVPMWCTTIPMYSTPSSHVPHGPQCHPNLIPMCPRTIPTYTHTLSAHSPHVSEHHQQLIPLWPNTIHQHPTFTWSNTISSPSPYGPTLFLSYLHLPQLH